MFWEWKICQLDKIVRIKKHTRYVAELVCLFGSIEYIKNEPSSARRHYQVLLLYSHSRRKSVLFSTNQGRYVWSGREEAPLLLHFWLLVFISRPGKIECKYLHRGNLPTVRDPNWGLRYISKNLSRTSEELKKRMILEFLGNSQYLLKFQNF